MKPSWHRRWRALALTVDLVFLGATLCAWTAARFGIASVPGAFTPTKDQSFARAPLLWAIPAWLAVYAVMRLYSPQRCHNALQEARHLATAGLGAGMALVFLGFIVKDNPARSWLAGAMVLGTLGAAVGRQTTRSVVTRLRADGKWMTPTVVVGRRQAKAIIDELHADPTSGIEIVGTCGFDVGEIRAWPIKDVADAVSESRAGQVLIVGEDLERDDISRAVEVADRLPVQIVVIPGLDYLMLSSLNLVTVGHEPGLAVESPVFHSYQAAVKRSVDVVGSLALIALTLPVQIAVAIAVRLDSRGPAFFPQEREGRDGKRFRTYKFRSMHADASSFDPEDLPPDDLNFLSKPELDKRITRVGRWLRRSSIDEIPQLYNVVRGDMSLVGPRPLRIWEAERLGLRRRLVVRPGLTGLWQVSGRSTLSAAERIRLDLVYVQNWSLLLDLTILLRTVPAVIGGRGAY